MASFIACFYTASVIQPSPLPAYQAGTAPSSEIKDPGSNKVPIFLHDRPRYGPCQTAAFRCRELRLGCNPRPQRFFLVIPNLREPDASCVHLARVKALD